MKPPKLPKGAIKPRPAVHSHGALLAAHRRPRRQTAARFQREHRRLLAARHRRPEGAARRRPPRRLSRIRRSQGGHRALFPRAARAVRLHQRHRRSHPGLHQHLCGRRPGSGAPASLPTPCTASMRKWPARRSRRSRTRSRAWSFRCRRCWMPSRRKRAPCCSPIPTIPPARASRCWASSGFCIARAKPWCWWTKRITNSRGVTAHHRDRARAESLRVPHVFQGLRHGGDAAGLPVLARGQRRAICTRRSRPTA